MKLPLESTRQSITKTHHYRHLFNELLAFLDDNKTLLHSHLDCFHTNTGDMYVIPMGQFLHMIEYPNVNPKYDKLYLIFSSKKIDNDGALNPMNNGSYNLIMYIIDDNDPSTIPNNFKSMDSVFIHEMAHFDDIEQRENRSSIKSTNLFQHPTNPSQTNLGQYYSTPEEYNAYFMQCIDQLECNTMFDTTSFNEYISFVYDNHIEKPFFDFLNKKYKRKLIKRLYKYFKHKHETRY